MQEIKITKGYVALVDDTDYNWINQYKWTAQVRSHTTYAYNGTVRMAMHSFIMQPEPGLVINHIDRNGLNNTRDNLEIMTQAEHRRLSSRMKNAKGKYRGVYTHHSGRFYAQIRVNYKAYHLGMFNTEEEAAQAYNDAGERMLGRGNFIMNEI